MDLKSSEKKQKNMKDLEYQKKIEIVANRARSLFSHKKNRTSTSTQPKSMPKK